VLAEIEKIERHLTAANYIEQLEHGITEAKDALKHLDRDDMHVRKMLDELQHIEKDYGEFMKRVMDIVEPL